MAVLTERACAERMHAGTGRPLGQNIRYTPTQGDRISLPRHDPAPTLNTKLVSCGYQVADIQSSPGASRCNHQMLRVTSSQGQRSLPHYKHQLLGSAPCPPVIHQRTSFLKPCITVTCRRQSYLMLSCTARSCRPAPSLTHPATRRLPARSFPLSSFSASHIR